MFKCRLLVYYMYSYMVRTLTFLLALYLSVLPICSPKYISYLQKFHRSAQSAAPKEPPPPTPQPACMQGLPTGCAKPPVNIKNIDQRNVICKNVGIANTCQ